MKPEQRQEKILQWLRDVRREWSVAEIARVLKVSPLTVRRDFDCLAQAGVILRTHGGCLYTGRMALDSIYHRRAAAHFELKQAIGAAAAREVRAGDALLINDGSTTFHLAARLGPCGRITVYTNSVAMIGELRRFPNVRLYILGGEYHPDLAYLGGSVMERLLETIAVDTVFLGTDAIDARGRCLVVDQDMARTAQMMLRRARRRILLADHTKAAAAGGVVYATLKDFDLWITTAGLASAARRRYRTQTVIKRSPYELFHRVGESGFNPVSPECHCRNPGTEIPGDA